MNDKNIYFIQPTWQKVPTMKSTLPLNDEHIDNNDINVNDNIIVKSETLSNLEVVTNNSLKDITVLYDCVNHNYYKL